MTGSQPFTRRNFLRGTVGGIATAGGMYGWATVIEPHWVQVTDETLSMNRLPERFRGKTLVQISDLHIGSTDEAYLMSTIETVNSLDADIIVITGDIVDHYHPDATDAVRRIFATMNPGKVATLGCLGNHDYGYRWAQPDVADRVTQAMNDRGVMMLRDQRVDVDGLAFFGIDDLWGPKFRAAGVMRDADADRDAICLCHNPDVCDRRVWADFRGVILSGHTHGGQCKPPWMTPPRLPVRNRTYVSGFYDVGHSRTLYINRGLGYGYRARFNCRPEITRFTLANRV